jgi:hypothetical protein
MFSQISLLATAVLALCPSGEAGSFFGIQATPLERGEVRLRKFNDFPPGIDGILYGYPDNKIGGLIVEGPFPYNNNTPAVWNDGQDPWGAYGLIVAAGKYQNKMCEAVPDNSPFAHSKLKPVPLSQGSLQCMIGCNLTEVAATGVDPCHVGSIQSPTNSPMSCFDVGPGFASKWGVCGYNCTALQSKSTSVLKPCSKSDLGKGLCNLYCDTRTFPATQ